MAISFVQVDRSPIPVYGVQRASNDRRYFDGSAAGRDAAIAAYGSGNGEPDPAADRCVDFWNSLGINTHIIYTDSDYANAAKVQICLDYLGVKHLRDAWRDSSNSQGLATYTALAAAGYKFDMLIKRSQQDFSAALSDLTGWLADHAGAVAAVEGPNEINNAPVTYDSQTGEAGGHAFMTDFYTAVQADSVLGTAGLDVPIFDLTGSFTANDCTHANIHCYPPNGAHPSYKNLQVQTQHANGNAGRPWVITEMGWFTAPNLLNGVDEATQAKLILKACATAFLLGFTRLYLYQLLDAYADQAVPINQEKWFGLFRRGYGPKPAADALHNLCALLADASESAASFTPTALSYRFLNLPNEAKWLLLQKASGSFYLLVWAEVPCWDGGNAQPLVVNVHSVTLWLTAPKQLSVYNPRLAAGAIATSESAQRFTFDLADDLLVLELEDS